MTLQQVPAVDKCSRYCGLWLLASCLSDLEQDLCQTIHCTSCYSTCMLSGQGQSTIFKPGSGKHLEEFLGRTPAHNNLVEQVCAEMELQQLLKLMHQLSCLCRTARQVLRGSIDTLVEDPAWLQLMTQLTAQALTCPAHNRGSHTLHDATLVEALKSWQTNVLC